jgi:hypothetical protein
VALIAVLLLAVLFCCCPNQGMRLPFLFKGLKLGTCLGLRNIYLSFNKYAASICIYMYLFGFFEKYAVSSVLDGLHANLDVHDPYCTPKYARIKIQIDISEKLPRKMAQRSHPRLSDGDPCTLSYIKNLRDK